MAEVKRMRKESERHYKQVKRQIIEKIKEVDITNIKEFNAKREAGWVKYGLRSKPLRL